MPPPPSVPVPIPLPRLPAVPTSEGSGSQSLPKDESLTNSVQLCEGDIKELARFVREFVTMGLVPWMEKCVTDWNEAVS